MARKKPVAKKKPVARKKPVAKKKPVATKKPAAKKKVSPIPKGYHTVTPYLVVEDVAGLIDFLKAAFDAKDRFRSTAPDGRVMHAEIQIGDSMMMLGTAPAPERVTRSMIYLYVKDCDRYYNQAIKAGATSVMEPANQFYGDRNGGVADRFGNQWWVGTHVEDVSPQEMKRRMASHGKQ